MDDPNRDYRDDWFTSSTPYDYSAFKNGILLEFPHKTAEQAAEAILACRKAMDPSVGRQKLKECVRGHLKELS